MSFRSSFHFPERVLRHIWSRQSLALHSLHTTDGRGVEVLHPGQLNTGSGPDFRQARIRIGGVLFAGDVEFHRSAPDWEQHQHSRDPHYDGVILHVVLEEGNSSAAARTLSGRQLPLLVLAPFLERMREESERQSLLDERARLANTIPCAESNYDIPADTLRRWVTHLGRERIQMKARRMGERMTELASEWSLHGGGTPAQALSRRGLWEQLLYEALMDGLGFSLNRGPFSRLSRAVTLETIAHLGIADTPLLIEALLFGAAGLLPRVVSRNDPALSPHAIMLCEAWNALHQRYRGAMLYEEEWTFAPLRPGNAPVLRLAQAATLIRKLMREEFFPTIIQRLCAEEDRTKRIASLKEAMSISASCVWRRQASAAHDGRLGEDRAIEMLTNIVVPFGILYARVFHRSDLNLRADELFHALPSAGSNAITRIVEGHLVRGKLDTSTAPVEQGLLQLHHFYCSRERCGECEVGRVLGLR